MAIRAGLLSDKIKVLRPAISIDDYGATVSDWSLRCEARARVVVSKVDRDNVNYADTFGTILTIETRIEHTIEESDRIEYDGRLYAIVTLFRNKQLRKNEIKAQLIRD